MAEDFHSFSFQSSGELAFYRIDGDDVGVSQIMQDSGDSAHSGSSGSDENDIHKLDIKN
jgi:hypothetical protein